MKVACGGRTKKKEQATPFIKEVGWVKSLPQIPVSIRNNGVQCSERKCSQPFTSAALSTARWLSQHQAAGPSFVPQTKTQSGTQSTLVEGPKWWKEEPALQYHMCTI